MSRSTLQRRLRDENTTFQDLMDNTRRSLAIEYVKEPQQSLTSRSPIVVVENFELLFGLWLRLLVTTICLVYYLNLGRFDLPGGVIWNLLPESILVLNVFSLNSAFPENFFFNFLHSLLLLYEVMLINFLCHFILKVVINLFDLFGILIIALFGLHNALLYIFSCVLDITFGSFEDHLRLLMVVKDSLLYVHLADGGF